MFQALAGINVEETVYMDFQDGGGKESMVLDHMEIGKVCKMVCCPMCCLFVKLAGKKNKIQYQRECLGCCNCPYSVWKNGVMQGRVSDVKCCANGLWFWLCPILNCTGHVKMMSMQDANGIEKIVFTKKLFMCWKPVAVVSLFCAPLGICVMGMTGCVKYCSGREFLTITQPVYSGPWLRASGGEPQQIGEMVQSYRFVPVGCCIAMPTPLKFFFRPTNDQGQKVAQQDLPLLSLTLAVYRGLPVPCRCCSPVDFQTPSGVSCLDLGLGTKTQWQDVQQVMMISE